MHRFILQKILLLLGISGLLFSGSFGQTAATVPNASFDTFNATDSTFPGWTFKKDSLGGTRYVITQATDTVHSGTGALKIQIKDAPDTSFGSAGVTGTITGLPPKKRFTVTAWVKYVNTTGYNNAEIAVSQATTLSVSPWYIFREWSTLWTNPIAGSSNGWTQISLSDSSVDSANYFNIIISLWQSGTLWVDDIAVTYQPTSAVKPDVEPQRQGSILNNRISFSRPTAYSFEACSFDGKILLRRTGQASELDLNRLDLKNGVYIVRVQTPDKSYTSKVMVSR